MTELSLIVAMDENQVIGCNNSLPWRLPNDLNHVKEITDGSTLIMGRKNFESIGRILPNRRHIILTRNEDYKVPGCEVYHSVKEVMAALNIEEEVFVFGGEEVYRLFLPYVKTMCITKIHETFEGDTFFPDINWDEWVEVYQQVGITDEKNIHPHDFYIYERKTVNSEV